MYCTYGTAERGRSSQGLNDKNRVTRTRRPDFSVLQCYASRCIYGGLYCAYYAVYEVLKFSLYLRCHLSGQISAEGPTVGRKCLQFSSSSYHSSYDSCQVLGRCMVLECVLCSCWRCGLGSGDEQTGNADVKAIGVQGTCHTRAIRQIGLPTVTYEYTGRGLPTHCSVVIPKNCCSVMEHTVHWYKAITSISWDMLELTGLLLNSSSIYVLRMGLIISHLLQVAQLQMAVEMWVKSEKAIAVWAYSDSLEMKQYEMAPYLTFEGYFELVDSTTLHLCRARDGLYCEGCMPCRYFKFVSQHEEGGFLVAWVLYAPYSCGFLVGSCKSVKRLLNGAFILRVFCLLVNRESVESRITSNPEVYCGELRQRGSQYRIIPCCQDCLYNDYPATHLIIEKQHPRLSTAKIRKWKRVLAWPDCFSSVPEYFSASGNSLNCKAFCKAQYEDEDPLAFLQNCRRRKLVSAHAWPLQWSNSRFIVLYFRTINQITWKAASERATNPICWNQLNCHCMLAYAKHTELSKTGQLYFVHWKGIQWFTKAQSSKNVDYMVCTLKFCSVRDGWNLAMCRTLLLS